jgi:hypothetical protein
MNPYICSAVNKMSDIANRNIQMNLAPQATSAAVGSGQFGSQRGAQVLGQVEANAEQCLNSSIANMLSTGYGQALCAAGKQQALLGTLGSTAASAQAQQAQAQNQVGANQTALGTAATNARLACMNALATLGQQQQTILQNQQCYPLTTLAKNASLLQGYTIPTSTSTTLCMSPLSAAAAVGSGVMGMITPNANGVTPLSSLQNALGSGSSQNCGSYTCINGAALNKQALSSLSPEQITAIQNQGSTTANPAGASATVAARGGLISSNGRVINSGSISTGCHSTQYRGALPSAR